jgi:hypothetical protein
MDCWRSGNVQCSIKARFEHVPGRALLTYHDPQSLVPSVSAWALGAREPRETLAEPAGPMRAPSASVVRGFGVREVERGRAGP